MFRGEAVIAVRPSVRRNRIGEPMATARRPPTVLGAAGIRSVVGCPGRPRRPAALAPAAFLALATLLPVTGPQGCGPIFRRGEPGKRELYDFTECPHVFAP